MQFTLFVRLFVTFFVFVGIRINAEVLQVLHLLGGLRSVSFPFFPPRGKRGDPGYTRLAVIQLYVLLLSQVSMYMERAESFLRS